MMRKKEDDDEEEEDDDNEDDDDNVDDGDGPFQTRQACSSHCNFSFVDRSWIG